MSGYKYSRTRILDAARSAAVAAGSQAGMLEEKLAGLTAGLEKALAATACNRQLFRPLQTDLAATLLEVRTWRSQADKQLQRWRLTTKQANALREQAQQFQQRLAQLVQQAGRAQNDLGLQAELAGFAAQLAAADRVAFWEEAQHAGLKDETARLTSEVHQRILARTDASPLAENLRSLAHRLQSLQDAVQQKEEHDGHRRCVLEKLRTVCANLGYQVTEKLPANPNLPVALEVNTGVYGLLHFEVMLDGQLNSHSWHMPTTTCETWVGRVEDDMRTLGIEIEFKYRDGDKPVRKTKTAKKLPASQQRTAAAGGT